MRERYKTAQYREIDDTGTTAWNYLTGIIRDYDLKRFRPHIEMRVRPVAFGSMPDEGHLTDDRVIQLVVENQMLAMVYLRRDEFNYTEVTTVFLQDTMKKLEKMLKEK